MPLRPFAILLISTLLTSPVCWAKKPGKIPVTEQVSSRLVPNRLSEFKVSPDGLSVAYTAGSGRYLDGSGGEGGSDWEYKTLIVDGQPVDSDNDWYNNPDQIMNMHYRKHVSPDGQRIAYIGDKKNGREREIFAVIDGKEGKRYSGIDAFPIFSPDSKHFAYMARTLDMKWTAVIDETEGRHFEAEYIHNPIFSPDSKRLAYIVTLGFQGGGAFVVVGDQVGKHFSTISGLVQFSFDSQHFAYVAIDGNKHFIVVDHQVGNSYDYINEVKYSPIDQQLAYVAYERNKAFVVLDGVPGRKYDSITDLTFSPDGKVLAYAAYNRKARQWFVVINGRETPTYDHVLAYGADEAGKTLVFSNKSSFRFETDDTLRFLAVR
jgi:Tol biopolymer transport system component